MVAEVHGELAYVERVLEGPLAPGQREKLAARRGALFRDRSALYATLKQFDSELRPETIGEREWKKMRVGRCQ